MSSTSQSSNLRLSVVVPTYGRPDRVRTLLERIDAQTLPPDQFEVIVVDDGTPMPITVDAARHRYSLQLLRQDNAGPGAARNLGVQHARAPIVIFFNDDAVPADDLLAVHVAAHGSGAKKLSKTAVLGTFTFTQDSLREPFTQLLADSDLLFDFPRLRHGEKHGWGFFWTCNISLPREALIEIGGFDADTFREAIVEDVELGYRLEKAGWSVLFRADARCEHQHPLTIDDYFRRAVRLGVNTVRMWRKHQDVSILWQQPGTRIDHEYTRSLQLKLENLLEPQKRFLDVMRRRSEELRGREWPREERAELVQLVRNLSWVPFARGALLELTGKDPVAVIEKGIDPNRSVSVVACSYNALEKTKACVDSLRRTVDRARPVEILFVDNGSTDGSAEWLGEQPDLIVIRNTENLGAPRARNQALARATGDYVVFMDNDIVLTPGWLERMIHHAEVDARSGCIAACADRASHRQDVPYDGPVDFDSLSDVSRAWARKHHRESRPAITLASFLMLTRREVIERIGGFDETFSPWGFEDDDYTLRAHAAGFWNRIALDVFVHHDTYVGPKLERHTALLAKNWAAFTRKWKLGAASHGDMTALADANARSWTRDELYCALPSDPAPTDFESRRAAARSAWAGGVAPTSGRSGTSYVAEQAQRVAAVTQIALEALDSGRHDDAERAIAGILPGNEGHPNLLLVQGLLAEHRALSAEDSAACDAALVRAESAYSRCLDVHDRPWVGELIPGATSWAASTRLGTVLVMQGREKESREAFESVLAERPGDVEASLGLCEVRLHEGDARGALATLQTHLTAPAPDSWILAAFACAHVGQIADAAMLAAAARERLAKAALLAPHRLHLLAEIEALVRESLPPALQSKNSSVPSSAPGPMSSTRTTAGSRTP